MPISVDVNSKQLKWPVFSGKHLCSYFTESLPVIGCFDNNQRKHLKQ